MPLRDDTEYRRDTWLAYRDRARAADYARHHTEHLTWARFAMWRERQGVGRALRRCHLSPSDTIVDLPCGTGILGDVLGRFPARVIAADVSREMMDLARGRYDPAKLGGFVQADITGTCFETGAFAGAVTLGLMHRLPPDIRRRAIAELARLARRFVIMSCSIDSHGQRMKRWLLRRLRSTYRPAPSPLPLGAMIEELRQHGLIVVTTFRVARFLSAEVVLLLEKRGAPA